MNNVNATVEGNTLVFRVDVSDASITSAPPSKTGKTKLVASSGGFQKAYDDNNGKKVSYNLTVTAK